MEVKEMPPFRILIVEDQPDTAKVLELLLTREGYTAKSEFSGNAALLEAARYRPHMMLIDLAMPGMNGIELARHCREMPELVDCRLIAMTSFAKSMIPTPSPFDQYMQKPVDMDAFLTFLSAIRATM